MTTDRDPTRRFTSRVDDYVRFRPRYPEHVDTVLRDELGLGASSVVADVGAGTGFSSEPFLRIGCSVIAVEPNDAMRAAADARLAEHPRFRSVAGQAESTTLASDSVDAVAAGQAFHWFDPDAARSEFRRILKADGPVVLFWNSRRTDTPFNAEYEAFIDSIAIDSKHLSCRAGPASDPSGFFDGSPRRWTFPHSQQFDFAGLRGRLTSSSYTPPRDHPGHAPMLEALLPLFEKHAVDGKVEFGYMTEIFVGTV